LIEALFIGLLFFYLKILLLTLYCQFLATSNHLPFSFLSIARKPMRKGPMLRSANRAVILRI
jgi:hypothetical protein